MSTLESFAYKITKKLAFPRMTGTEGAFKAAEIIESELRDIGYLKIYKEKFKSTIINWIIYKYFFIYIGLVFIGLPIIYNFDISMVPGLIIPTLFLLALYYYYSTNTRGLSGVDKYEFDSKNIYVKQESEKKKNNIIIMAHYDSKSQTYPAILRILIIFVPYIFLLLYLMLYLTLFSLFMFFHIEAYALNEFTLYLSYFMAFISFLNVFNSTGNESPGAADNAAGAAVVMTLAKYFKQNPLKNSQLYFLLTDAEEMGLTGSYAFLKNNKDNLKKENTYFINLDVIGADDKISYISSYGIPKKHSSETLNNLISYISEKKKIDTKSLYMPIGAWSDFMPVIKSGYEACWLASSGLVKYLHTKKDNMEIVTEEGLKNCINLVEEVVKELDGNSQLTK